MTLARHRGSDGVRGWLTRAREVEEIHGAIQNVRAARTVASHAADAEDCGHLLEMLGLDARDARRELTQAEKARIEDGKVWGSGRTTTSQ